MIRIGKVITPKGLGIKIKIDECGEFVLIDKKLPKQNLTQDEYDKIIDILLDVFKGYIPLDEA